MTDPQPVDQSDPPPATPKKPRNRRKIIIILILAFFACGACGIISTLITGNDNPTTIERTVEVEQAISSGVEALPTDKPSTTFQPADTSEPVATAEPTTAPTSPPEPTPAPRATNTPSSPNIDEFRELTAAELALRDVIDESLGESNRGLGRKLNLFSTGIIENSIIIGWQADGATSDDLIREGMQRDTLKVLTTVIESGMDYAAISIGSTYRITNEQLGITDEMEVLTLLYYKDTLDAIDWATVSDNEIFPAADLFIIHPRFD